MADVVYDSRAGFVAHPNAADTHRPQTNPDRFHNVNLNFLQCWHEFDAAIKHRSKRSMVLQIDRQITLVGLRQAPEHKHVAPAGHNEDEAILVRTFALRNAIGLGDRRDRAAVVASSD